MRSKSAKPQWLFQYSTQARLHRSSSSHPYYVKTQAKNGIFYKSDNKWKHGGGFGWHTQHITREESVSTLLHSVSLLISIISTYANLLWVTFQRKVSTLTTEREPDRGLDTTDTRCIQFTLPQIGYKSAISTNFYCHNFKKKRITNQLSRFLSL